MIFEEITQPDYTLETLIDDEFISKIVKTISEMKDHDSVIHSICISGFLTSISGNFTEKLVETGLLDSLLNLIPFFDRNNTELHIKVLWVLGNIISEEQE